MVWIPPQHGKSELISGHTPSWFLGRFPDSRLALISYSQTMATRWGRKSRDLFRQYAPTLWGQELSRSVHGAKEWEVANRRGGMVSVGIGGSLTGRPVDFAIIDDPVKDQVEAFSSAKRKRAKEWYQSVLKTRMSKNGKIVVLQTRWHEDDLSGWLYRVEDDWLVINLPALAYDPALLPEKERAEYEGDPLARRPGEPLCPELKPLEFLLDVKKGNEYFFAAMYQGRPVPLEGGLFRKAWFKRWAAEYLPVDWDEEKKCWYYPRHDRRFDEVISSWDFPKGHNTYGSFVVGQVWGRRGTKLFLLDQFRARCSFKEMVEAVHELRRRWPMMGATIIELKAAGGEVKRAVEHHIPGVIGKIPEGSKEARAAAVTYRFQAGNVFIPNPASAPWVDDYLEELCAFPNGPYNDQVDVTTQAVEHFEGSFGMQEQPVVRAAPRRTDFSRFRV